MGRFKNESGKNTVARINEVLLLLALIGGNVVIWTVYIKIFF